MLSMHAAAAASGHGAQAGGPQVAPFAVAEAPSDVYPSDFHLVTRMKQEVTGKVGFKKGYAMLILRQSPRAGCC